MQYEEIALEGFIPTVQDEIYYKTKERFIEWLCNKAHKVYGHLDFIDEETIKEEWEYFRYMYDKEVQHEF